MSLPAYVLVGGRSTRMGRDKARIHIDGVPLALRIAAVLADAGCGPVHLVGKAAWDPPGPLPWVLDDAPDGHPLLGVAAALRHAAASGAALALTCPCDLVGLDVASVRTLLAAGGPCIASDGERSQPLLAVLATSQAEAVRALADAGAPVRAATTGLPVVVLPADVLRNANHPGDLPGPTPSGPGR
ncbi:MAG: NTP transferase domain-containing protein [Alphaproteobacteria bacterium]|nr:NTP transferase domain-containing protein [Alphaproteobacteria bacterium]